MYCEMCARLHPILCGIKQLTARSLLLGDPCSCVVLRYFNALKELVSSPATRQLAKKNICAPVIYITLKTQKSYLKHYSQEISSKNQFRSSVKREVF